MTCELRQRNFHWLQMTYSANVSNQPIIFNSGRSAIFLRRLSLRLSAVSQETTASVWQIKNLARLCRTAGGRHQPADCEADALCAVADAAFSGRFVFSWATGTTFLGARGVKTDGIGKKRETPAPNPNPYVKINHNRHLTLTRQS